MRHSWSRFKPVRRQQEEIDLKNALLILALVVVAVNCFYRAVSGRHEIFTGKVVELVTPDLDERILSDRSGRPWVLTLWSPYCDVCRGFSDELNVVARDFAPHVSFGHINLEKWPDTADRFRITEIPAVLFIRNGREVDRANAMSRSELATWIVDRLTTGPPQ